MDTATEASVGANEDTDEVSLALDMILSSTCEDRYDWDAVRAHLDSCYFPWEEEE